MLADATSIARVLRVVVPGVPIAQGSKTARVVGKRVAVNGQSAVLGARAVLVEKSNLATKTMPSGRLDRWRSAVARHAQSARKMIGLELFTGPVELDVEFVLPRPDGHYTKASGRLRKSAPAFPALPDLSKLVRAVEDALTETAYADDRQVVQINARKRYAVRGGVGGAVIIIRGKQ